MLAILEDAGADGVFVYTFVSPALTHNEDPRYDLDMASYSLVKSYADKHGVSLFGHAMGAQRLLQDDSQLLRQIESLTSIIVLDYMGTVEPDSQKAQDLATEKKRKRFRIKPYSLARMISNSV